MSLVIDGPGGLHAIASPGAWTATSAVSPRAACRAIAGLEDLGPGVVLDDVELGTLRAARRARSGLQVVTGEVVAQRGVLVIDVILLAAAGANGLLPAGGAASRLRLGATEARARALAGRWGLAGWLDVAAVGLPSSTSLAVDAARALLAEPRGLVVADVGVQGGGAVLAMIREESQRLGCAAITIRDDVPMGWHD